MKLKLDNGKCDFFLIKYYLKFLFYRLLEQESLEHLMKALKFIADGNTTIKVGDTKLYSNNNLSREGSYDPAAVFFLELMINVTLQNRDRIHYLW